MSTIVSRPAYGEVLHVPIRAGSAILFDFDLGAASVSRHEDGLVFNTRGAQVVIQGFFSHEAEALPEFNIEGNDMIPGQNLLRALDATELAKAEDTAEIRETAETNIYRVDANGSVSFNAESQNMPCKGAATPGDSAETASTGCRFRDSGICQKTCGHNFPMPQ